jgi:hypothetical protein
MASEAEECTWLKEHLVYEYDMLRYSFGRIQELPEGPEWNAHFVCFAVHARLLKDFLANDGKGNNFKAREFVKGYEATPTPNLGRRMENMNEQVFHAGKQRREPYKKIHTGELTQLHEWLCRAIEDFALKLEPTAYGKYWTPRHFPATMIVALPQQSQSSSASSWMVKLPATGSKDQS